MLSKLLKILNDEDLNYLDHLELNRELNLRDDLQLDSLDQVHLVMAIEDEFNTEIGVDEFDTIGELIDYLEL